MNLEISATDYTEEKNEVELNLQSKLVLENGSTGSLKINRWVVCCTIQFSKHNL